MPEPALATSHPVGSRLVAADGTTLPLRAAHLRCEAGAGFARTHLSQRFANPHDEPLAVTYQLALPADGAIAAFAFTIGERRVVGEIDRREAARERYEQALVDGHTAALVEQDRDSLFCQEIGNIPPGAEVLAELTVDQPLQWLADGQWEWRFPTVIAPRYLGGPGRTPDARRVAVDVADGTLPPRLGLELQVLDALQPDDVPSSPSHPLSVAHDDAGTRLTFAADGGAHLDRDVVVRWGVAAPEIGAALITARPGPEHDRAGDVFGLLTIVPPSCTHAPGQIDRDVIVLLDTSGSMHGEPLAQAKAVTAALIRNLTPRDRLEMIAFASRPRAWNRRAVLMDERGQAAALRWLDELQAGGATEMGEAVIAALRPLNPTSLRQVVLVTDGQIGFEEEIVREVLHRLPRSSRLHTVGVGSCPNRSLTRSAARAGRGTETLIGLGEDPGVAAVRLSAATSAPQLVELEVGGSALLETAPEHIPDVLAGMPARVAVKLRPQGGELVIRGRTAEGAWHREVAVADSMPDSAPDSAPDTGRPELVTLFGREQVADLEARIAAGEGRGLEQRIEALGLSFAIATRRTSWVAVSTGPGVDPSEPLRRERIPQELPHGMSIERLGLRTAMGAAPMEMMADMPAAPRAPRIRGRFLRSIAAPFVEEEFDSCHEEPAARPLYLAARIALRRDGFLVVELVSDGREWRLPALVELVSTDGRTFAAEVDVGHTTRDGEVPAGTTIRLRLREPVDARDLTFRAVRLDGQDVELEPS